MEQNRKRGNKTLYKVLKKDTNYTHVRFNKKTGALSAIHKDHKFDTERGIFGIPRGDYERNALAVLYRYGRKIIFASEKSKWGVKTPDGWLDDEVFDIKGVESQGYFTVRNKFLDANKQQASVLVLYYHTQDIYSEELLKKGYELYFEFLKQHNDKNVLTTIYYIVVDKLYRFK